MCKSGGVNKKPKLIMSTRETTWESSHVWRQNDNGPENETTPHSTTWLLFILLACLIIFSLRWSMQLQIQYHVKAWKYDTSNCANIVKSSELARINPISIQFNCEWWFTWSKYPKENRKCSLLSCTFAYAWGNTPNSCVSRIRFYLVLQTLSNGKTQLGIKMGIANDVERYQLQALALLPAVSHIQRNMTQKSDIFLQSFSLTGMVNNKGGGTKSPWS